MKGSWKLGDVAGIGVFVHWTFLILLTWVFAAYLMSGQGWVMAVEGAALVLAIFACIVLHELGHALTARRYNIPTRDITLLPIGGVARLERIPEDPTQELWVALAGPAVNIVIAAGLFVVVTILGDLGQLYAIHLVGGHFLAKLMWINILLVAFNLLPAFPMDGGRVLRALLARRLPYLQATQVAAGVGQAMAVLFGILGIFTNWWLLFIAVFVYLGAEGEARLAEIRSILKGVPVREAMITQFYTVSADETLTKVIGELSAGCLRDVPVVDHDRVVGLLRRGDVMKAIAEGNWDTRVRDCMYRDCPVLEENETLERPYQRMESDGFSTLPVVQAGYLVGVITLESIADWMMVRSALNGKNAFAGDKRHTPHPSPYQASGYRPS